MDNVEINVTVNGKSVPLSTISTETFEKIRDAEEEENTSTFLVADDVLVIRLTDKCRETLNNAMSYNDSYIGLLKDGDWDWGFCGDETFEDVKKHYGDIKPLFKEI